MQGRKIISRLIAALITLTTVISLLSLTASAAAETVYDYSRPGSQHTVTMSSADILENILATPLTEAERKYLVAYGEDEIKYDDGITTSYVIASYQDGTLSVAAREYTYLTESDTEIVWTPVRATLLGVTKELSRSESNTYDATFFNVPEDDDALAVSVVYSLDITVSAEMANSLVNKAYNDVPALRAEMDEATSAYEAALDEYTRAKEEYDAYLLALDQHKADTEARAAYLIAQRDYEAAVKKYNNYLAAKLAFEAALDERADYLAEMEQYKADYADYSNFLNEYKKYENLYSIYQSQMDAVNLCRSHLKIIDLCKVKMTSLNRSLYDAVVSSTLVDFVLYERDTLENLPTVEVSPAVIDLADRSTKNLRILLTEYFSLETEMAKYNYYAQNYTAFCESFNGLFVSLHYLSSQKWMPEAIAFADKLNPGEDRYYKLKILVAQLYLVCMAISDSPVTTIDPSYLTKYEAKETLTPSGVKFGCPGYRQSLKDLFGDYTKYITDTNNAKPITTGFPSVDAEPTAPPVVNEPKMPAYVPEPVAPTEVDDPGDPPAYVEDPGDPPAEVTEPTLPEEPVFPEEVLALVAAYGNEVKERDISFDSPVTVRVESAVNKRFINVETVNVTFYHSDGTPYHTTVDRGTYADYRGPVPQKAEDARATYAFAGWQTTEGERVDVTSVNEDIKLYPYFEETLKFYTVTWDVNGELKHEKLVYGATPSYTGVPKKPSTGEHKYVFAGWSPEITEVTGDVTYVAEFREQEIISSVPGVTVIYDGESFTFDATGSLVSSFDLTGLFELRTPFSEAKVYTAFATVELSPQLLDVLESCGVTGIRIDAVASGNAKRSYTVLALGSDGEPVELPSAEMEISFAMGEVDYSRIRVRRMSEDGTASMISYTVSDGVISFTGQPNCEYSVSSEYVTHAVSSDFANITTQNASYFLGDTVKVNVTLGVGKKLVKLFYRTADGREEIIYNRTFVMPAEDVTVIAVVEEIMCKVTFMSEGGVLTSILVPYGSIPTPPAESPKKAGDENYNYVFEGWSPEISVATSDVVYTAIYRAEPVVRGTTSDRITVYEILTIAVAALFVILLGATVWVGIVVIKRFRG